jgi:hypothetical protein
MKRPFAILCVGLVIQFIGFIWDFYIHLTSGLAEGLNVFFKVPAHNLIVIGYGITWVSLLLFLKERRQ